MVTGVASRRVVSNRDATWVGGVHCSEAHTSAKIPRPAQVAYHQCSHNKGLFPAYLRYSAHSMRHNKISS